MKIIKYIIAIIILGTISIYWFGENEIASVDRIIPKNISEDLREDNRKLSFNGAHNFRDLGGYKTKMEKL